MTEILLNTIIYAPIDRCFDLARDIDIHQRSTSKTKEKAIAGRTSGLCELNDTVTWEAVHFGIRQKLTVQITAFEKPLFFEDKMLKGAFKSMHHRHEFEARENGHTLMTDIFRYEVPLGFIGKCFDAIVLKRYMRKFLEERNRVLKLEAEAESLNKHL